MLSCILLYPFAVSKHRLPLVERSSTNIIYQRAQRANLSINLFINRPISHGQSRSGKATPSCDPDRNTCNALNLKAQPPPPAVPTRRSSESNRTAQHIVHTSSRPQTASPAESNRTAFPSRATGSPLFPACPALRPSSSPSARHSAQSAHCPGISADYQRTIDPLRTNIRKFRLFSRPPTATSITLPRTARLSHLSKHIPRSHSRVSPHIQAIPPFCLTMPQAPRLLVWFLTLPSQIARAALRRIGGKPPCPLAICSLVRFTETKQRRLLATKSNQKRRN